VKGSLRRRFLYSFIAVMVLILAGVSVGTSVLIREYFIGHAERDLVNKGYEIGQVVASYNEGHIDYGQFSNYLNVVDTFIDARVWVVDSSRKVVAISEPKHRGMHGSGMTPEHGFVPGPGWTGPGERDKNMILQLLSTDLAPVFSGQMVTRVFMNPLYGENMVIVAVPLLTADGKVSGAVVLNSPVRGIDRVLNRLYFYIGGIGLLALLVTFLIVRNLAKRIVSPLKDMQESAAAMACGDYNTRITINTDDEVGELGKSLNTLAQELNRFVSNTTKAEKLRRDFIANVSHELRTPITIIRGYTEALLDGTISEAQQAEKYHQLMRDETIRLEGLINELLDLSRLQAGNALIEMEKVPLAIIAEGVVTMLKQRAEQGGVALNLKSSSATCEIFGNGDRLTQLLLILLDNALKFTPPGGKILVSVDRQMDKVILIVKDSGGGISLEDLPFIWERFYKADKSHTRTGAGTGLGLAIAKEIIDRHGAKVDVTSRLGEGTSFRIDFPVS